MGDVNESFVAMVFCVAFCLPLTMLMPLSECLLPEGNFSSIPVACVSLISRLHALANKFSSVRASSRRA